MAYLMIVDDDEDFAVVAAEVLRREGHEVSVELSTRSAQESMAKRRPDLLILDVMFPESSSGGFDLARTLRHCEPLLKDVPILMLTAVNEKAPLGFSADDIDDHWLPVADFLEKPVNLGVLRNKVSALLQGAGSPSGSR